MTRPPTPPDVISITARMPNGWVAICLPAEHTCRVLLVQALYSAVGVGMSSAAASLAATVRLTHDGKDGPTADDVDGALAVALDASRYPSRYVVDQHGCLIPASAADQARTPVHVN